MTLHTLSSRPIGYDSYGHQRFATKRTELGELVYRLKNQNDRKTAEAIAEIVGNFINSMSIRSDIIVPVPASRTRSFYPVIEIAKKLGDRLAVEVCGSCVTKARQTRELKEVFDYKERLKELEGAFDVKSEKLKGRRVLLLDDLYRSGATLESVARAVKLAEPTSIVALAITKTRTRR